jgi:hypothetical protein
MSSPTRILVTFCVGVAATLAWHSYGDAARQIIAKSHPQLGWLAPRAASIAPGAPSPDAQQKPTDNSSAPPLCGCMADADSPVDRPSLAPAISPIPLPRWGQ